MSLYWSTANAFMVDSVGLVADVLVVCCVGFVSGVY